MWPLELRICDSQIVIMMNYVVVSSVGIKRVVCIERPRKGQYAEHWYVPEIPADALLEN